MSRSFGVKILLPMDQHNSDEVYAADEKLEKVSSDQENGKYCKTLKIRSTYASSTDIRAYLIEKYGLSDEDFRNYSASYRFGYCNYHFTLMQISQVRFGKSYLTISVYQFFQQLANHCHLCKIDKFSLLPLLVLSL